MAQRFGSQAHPSGGLRFGSQTYAAVNAAAGDLAAVESGTDIFAAAAQPSIHVTANIVETGTDIFAAAGVSSLSHTMQAHEPATPDTFIASGHVIDAALRFGNQDHPLGGLRFGSQSWAALGPSGPMSAVESGTDTVAAVGWRAGTVYQFQIFDVLASFVDYGSESLGAAITGTLEDGYKVMLPVSADGIAFTWETNAFGNPSLRLANLAGATTLDDIPWYVWDGSAWTAATFDVSDAMQGAVFMVEAVADVFTGNGSNTRYGSIELIEVGSDFTVIAGGVRIAGALAASEVGADTVAVTGAPHYIGTVFAVESGEDAAEVAGSVLVGGAVSASETSHDSFTATGASSHAGDLAATEAGADTFAASGRLVSTGVMAATESATADTLGAEGAVVLRGTFATTESGTDVFAADGASDRVGLMAQTEAGTDTAAIDGTVLVSGDMVVIDAADRFAATGQREFQGDFVAAELDAMEGGADRFIARGRYGDIVPISTFDGPLETLSSTRVITVRSRRTAEAA